MNSSQLLNKKCVPCETGEGKLAIDQIKEFLMVIPDWLLIGDSIVREFQFKNFKQAMLFVNRIADLAENEGHHPDLCISWNKVKITLYTHAVKGLTENDFIMAVKIDQIMRTNHSS